MLELPLAGDLLLLLFAGTFFVSTQSAKSYLEQQLSMKNADNATVLALALDQQGADKARMEETISAQFDTGSYKFIELRDPQGKLSPFSPHGYDSVSVIINALNEVAVESDGMLIIPRQALALALAGRWQALESLAGRLGALGGRRGARLGPVRARAPLPGAGRAGGRAGTGGARSF